MKSPTLFISALLSLAATCQVSATTLSYDHSYKDVSKEHSDEIAIEHKFDSGFTTSLEVDFVPEEQDDGQAGKAFDNNQWDETKISANYAFDINEKLTLSPGMSWSQLHDEHKYKPFLKLKYNLTPTIDISSRYRYEITDYTYKKTKYKNRFDIGVSKKLGDFKIGYKLTLFHSNKELYNNKKEDYENKISLSYKLTKQLVPFIELKDESVSSHTTDRQTAYKIGVKYKF